MIRQQKNLKQRIQHGLARADYARYLSACYYQPDVIFVEEQLFDSMMETAKFLHPDLFTLSKQMKDAFSVEKIPSLLVEYTKLFLGPSDTFAKPYASIWQSNSTGSLMQDSTMALLELYQEQGFEMAEDAYAPPDHIAVQLEFLYLLLFKSNELLAQEKMDEANTLDKQCQQFLQAHMKNWLMPFLSFVKEHAQSDFYQALSQATQVFIFEELSCSTSQS